MDVVEKLTADLRYGNLLDRRAALHALEALGPAAAPALPDLVPALRDPDEEVRIGVTATLRAVGPAAVPTLLEAMLPDDVATRRVVMRALGDLGPDASAAVPVLVAARQDPQLRADAAWALGEIQGHSLADLRQRLRRAVPLLALGAVAYLMVALAVWLGNAPATVSVSSRLATALAVLGAGLGGLFGGAQAGRTGVLAGVLALGVAGYFVGVLAGGMAETILGPLGNVLGRK